MCVSVCYSLVQPSIIARLEITEVKVSRHLTSFLPFEFSNLLSTDLVLKFRFFLYSPSDQFFQLLYFPLKLSQT